MKKKKIIFWSPFLSNVGTKLAVLNSAMSLSKNNTYKIYIFNVLGEFNGFKNTKIEIINIFNIERYLPKTKIFSKFFLILICIYSIPFLIFYIRKHKFDYLVSNLMSIIPLVCNFFFLNTKIILSIQGYPRFNILRSYLWKIFYSKAYMIIVMSNATKKIISKIIKPNTKIVKINNPIITNKIRKYANEKIEKKYSFIFKKKVAICVGRLTRQKNYYQLVSSLSKNKIFNKNYNLVILGEGEDRKKLNNFILENKINNIFLLGYKKNPYKYIKNSDVFISSSLWEDPGHSLIEAASLNIPIITSNCPAAPNEIFINNFNSIKFKLVNFDKDVNASFNNFDKMNFKIKKKLCKKAFEISKNFTPKNYLSEIQSHIL